MPLCESMSVIFQNVRPNVLEILEIKRVVGLHNIACPSNERTQMYTRAVNFETRSFHVSSDTIAVATWKIMSHERQNNLGAKSRSSGYIKVLMQILELCCFVV